MWSQKKTVEELRENKILNQAKREVSGFTELLGSLERTVSVLGRSQSTFNNYSRHVASISFYFGKRSTELDAEQIHDYLFYLQKKSKSPSQTYFKHCVYGLRFLLKSEGLSLEMTKAESFTRKALCESTGKSRKTTFSTQMSVLHNREFTSDSYF